MEWSECPMLNFELLGDGPDVLGSELGPLIIISLGTPKQTKISSYKKLVTTCSMAFERALAQNHFIT